MEKGYNLYDEQWTYSLGRITVRTGIIFHPGIKYGFAAIDWILNLNMFHHSVTLSIGSTSGIISSTSSAAALMTVVSRGLAREKNDKFAKTAMSTLMYATALSNSRNSFSCAHSTDPIRPNSSAPQLANLIVLWNFNFVGDKNSQNPIGVYAPCWAHESLLDKIY